jgi:hypothetical protein
MSKFISNVQYSILILFLLLGYLPYSFGQDHASLMGGLNSNQFSISGTSNYENESLNLFFVGLSLEEDFNQKWKFNTFIQYVQKGGMLQVPGSTFLTPSSLRLQMIDILPSLEYKFVEFLGVYAGGNVSYLFRTDQKIGANYQKVDAEYFNRINYGAVIGAKFYVGNSGFNIHWNRGLNNIISTTGDLPPQGFELQSHSWQLGFTLYL